MGVSFLFLLTVSCLISFTACLVAVPIVPFPKVVRVANPANPPPGASPEALTDMYSASPNRNPEGLGVLGIIWLNSNVTLLTWPVMANRLEKERVAYAFGETEQRKRVSLERAFFEKHWVFEGILLGDFPNTLFVEFFQPHGIYLIDDAGRKFLPLEAENRGFKTIDLGDGVFRRVPMADNAFPTDDYSLPWLAFPKQAITSRTRAVSLYFAAYYKRLRFTWIFDPDYELPLSDWERPGSAERRGLFRRN